MRVLRNNNEVIQSFVSNTHLAATNQQRSLFFDRNLLFSYGTHYLLAERIDTDIIYINDRGYSATTNRHILRISQATRHLTQIFATEYENELVLIRLKNLTSKLDRAIKPLLYIPDIVQLIEQYRKNRKILNVELCEKVEKYSDELLRRYDIMEYMKNR